MKKRNINHLSGVHKNDVLNTKNLQIITRQGTEIGEDKAKTSSTMLQNHEYLNLKIQRKIFNDATQVFKELAMQEDNLDHQKAKVNELLQLLSKQYVVRQLVDLLKMLKDQPQVNRKIKNVCKTNQVDIYDLDPQVYLDIEGVFMPKVVINFGSQVSILPKSTWIKLS